MAITSFFSVDVVQPSMFEFVKDEKNESQIIKHTHIATDREKEEIWLLCCCVSFFDLLTSNNSIVEKNLNAIKFY